MFTKINKVSECENILEFKGLYDICLLKRRGEGRAIWFFRWLSTHLDSSIPHCTHCSPYRTGVGGGGCIVVMVKEQIGSGADAVWLRLTVIVHIHHEPVFSSGALLQRTRVGGWGWGSMVLPYQMPWNQGAQQGWCHTDLPLHPSVAAAFTASILTTAVWSICCLQIPCLKVWRSGSFF